METNFNFNSAVCTSIDQSRRLLSLGLKKETADMAWLKGRSRPIIFANPFHNDSCIPAWSLCRLWELANLRHIILDSEDEIPKLYDEVIAFIEFEIKESQFNKDYLVWQEKNQ